MQASQGGRNEMRMNLGRPCGCFAGRGLNSCSLQCGLSLAAGFSYPGGLLITTACLSGLFIVRVAVSNRRVASSATVSATRHGNFPYDGRSICVLKLQVNTQFLGARGGRELGEFPCSAEVASRTGQAGSCTVTRFRLVNHMGE